MRVQNLDSSWIPCPQYEHQEHHNWYTIKMLKQPLKIVPALKNVIRHQTGRWSSQPNYPAELPRGNRIIGCSVKTGEKEKLNEKENYRMRALASKYLLRQGQQKCQLKYKKFQFKPSNEYMTNENPKQVVKFIVTLGLVASTHYCKETLYKCIMQG